MTPIDNDILTEMLDNALSDIKYLRNEVAALREAKAEAKAEAYEAREEADSAAVRIDELEDDLRQANRQATEAHTKAQDIIVALREERLILQQDFREANGDKYEALRRVAKLEDELAWDTPALMATQAERISDLNAALRKATLRAHENADKLAASVKQAQDWADKYGRSEREVERLTEAQARTVEQAQTLEGRLRECREALRLSVRESSDLEDQLALYQDNCECSL